MEIYREKETERKGQRKRDRGPKIEGERGTDRGEK
jgi:hypothetical protein